MTLDEAHRRVDAAFDALAPGWRRAGLATRPEPNYSLAPRPDGRIDYVLATTNDAGVPAFEAALRTALGDAAGDPIDASRSANGTGSPAS